MTNHRTNNLRLLADLIDEHGDDAYKHVQFFRDSDKAWRATTALTNEVLAAFMLTDKQYRRKLKTISIGNYDVPEPLRTMNQGELYYVLMLAARDDELYVRQRFDCSAIERLWLKRGLCHATKEAAELHAKALLSFTQMEDEE